MKIMTGGELPTETYARYLVFGPTGSGKSTLGSTMPRPRIVFAADANAGIPLARTLEEVPRAWTPEGETNRTPDVFIQIETGDDLDEALVWLEKNAGAGQYNSICIDHLTALTDLVFRHVLSKRMDETARKWQSTSNRGSASKKPEEVMDQRGYGMVSRAFEDLRYRIHALPLHVLWLAGFKPPTTIREGNTTEVRRGGPDLQGQQKNRFPSNVMMSAYIERDTDSHGNAMPPRLRTSPFQDIDCKDNSGLLDTIEVADITVLLARMGFLDDALAETVEKAVPRRTPEEKEAADLGLSL